VHAFPLLNDEKIDGQVLLQMVDGRIKANTSDIVEALSGRIRRHHRDMLSFHWDHMMYLEKTRQNHPVHVRNLKVLLFGFRPFKIAYSCQ
jgi:hypothetical protein